MKDWFGGDSPLSPAQRWAFLIGLMVGAAAGWLVATFPGWVEAWDTAHWWEIATAFGTVGAVIAAVAVSLTETVLRIRERRRREAVVWGQIADEVVTLRQYLISIKYELEKLIRQSGTSRAQPPKREQWDRWNCLLKEPKVSEGQFLHLPLQRAIVLARIPAHLKNVKFWLSSLHDWPEEGDRDPADRYFVALQAIYTVGSLVEDAMDELPRRRVFSGEPDEKLRAKAHGEAFNF